MKIAVICAMEEEIAPLRERSSIGAREVTGKTIIEHAIWEGEELLLVECGIGKANAAVGAALLADRHRPDLIINSGSAGAFDPSLAVGDVVVPTTYVYGDVDATCFGYAWGQMPQMPAAYDIDEAWLGRLRGIAREQAHALPYRIDFGLALTLDSFMSDGDRVQGILAQQPETKVSDMEGLAIVEVGQRYGIPVVAVKAVSDIAGHGAESADSFDENVDLAGRHAVQFTELLIRAARGERAENRAAEV
ncbi:5'-methylthioadenosine/S-adenosylhomocysteine nucleosidase [Saccharibacillus sp. O23]|uniref:5'-methylthioadenosine/S-adenosylhomocysteine nucleosidase n=1 Tax=Saccharibacillus sp. O23 TaxID=2009338 RepID=UPI000B4DFF7E|nr:5'-methylthioadenosine/S-adenosylhomocysteine nucleosidase [Saccharibacillus sp. O23]OWR29962.1 5'-methylthioadenosine/S-adenosylhomocysteine nucleosidase [Saccharibacillus sp. O23]